MIQQSIINPKLSAYAQVHGVYDFNDTPVTPPGIRAVVNERIVVFKSCEIQVIDDW